MYEHEVRDHSEPCEHGDYQGHPNPTVGFGWCNGGKLLKEGTYHEGFFYLPEGTRVYYDEDTT